MTNAEILPCSNAFSYFLKNTISFDRFDNKALNAFAKLDDYDIISALKQWQDHSDFVLSELSRMIINRDLLKIKIKKKKVKPEKLSEQVNRLIDKYNLTEKEAEYFVFSGEISNLAYQQEKQNINILYKSGKIEDIVKASDQLNLKALSKPVTKYFICYPKD